MLWRYEHGCDYVAVQQFKIACFIMHILETINFQIRFYEDTSQKKGLKNAHDQSKGEKTKLLVWSIAVKGIINYLGQPH